MSCHGKWQIEHKEACVVLYFFSPVIVEVMLAKAEAVALPSAFLSSSSYSAVNVDVATKTGNLAKNLIEHSSFSTMWHSTFEGSKQSCTDLIKRSGHILLSEKPMAYSPHESPLLLALSMHRRNLHKRTGRTLRH